MKGQVNIFVKEISRPLVSCMATIAFLVASNSGFGQCLNIDYGPTEICVGVPTEYSAAIDLSCGGGGGALEDGTFTWHAVGGTVLGSGQNMLNSNATVVWGEGGGTLWVEHHYINTITSQILYAAPFAEPFHPGSIDFNAEGSSLCPGEAITLTAEVDNGPYQFEWEYSSDSGANWTPMPVTPIRTTTFTLSVSNAANYNLLFRVRTRSTNCYDRVSAYGQSAYASAYRFPDISLAAVNQICSSQEGIQVTHNNPAGSGYTQMFVNVLDNGQSPYPKNGSSLIPLTAPGSYTVRVNDYTAPGDFNPCYVEQVVVLAAPVTHSVSVSVLGPTVVHEACNGSAGTGSFSVSATGSPSGTGSGAAVAISSYSLSGGPSNGGEAFSGTTASLLHGGYTYSVTVTDANGCTGIANQVINEPSPILLNADPALPPTCPNGDNGGISFSPSGGTSPYQVRLNNGDFTSAEGFSGLGVGDHTIFVRDNNSCTQSFPISIPNQSPPSIGTPSVVHPTCSGTSTGGVSLTASGGAGALTFSIPGYSAQSIGNQITGISPGTYNVTVNDATCGNYSAGSVVINQPVSAAHSANVASCSTVNDGSIIVTSPTGGTGSYTYALNYGSYSSFSATTDFTGLPAGGSYTLSVRDGNSCTSTIPNITVGMRPALSTSISQTSNILCNGQATGALDLTTGNEWSSPYTYLWRRNSVSTGLTTQDVSGLVAGNYEVTVTDAVGCSTTANHVINEPGAITANFSIPQTNGFAIACRNATTGSINLTPGGGTPGGGPAYTYLWYRNDVSTGLTTEDLTGLDAANYRVRITDGNGCQLNTSNQTLNQPPTSVSVSVTGESDIACFGANTGSITVSGITGFGALQYRLDGVSHDVAYQASNSFIGLPPDTYTVVAMDANSCTATSGSVVITQPSAALSFSSVTPSNPTCFGTSTGSFTLAAEGGTSPYHFTVNGTNFFPSTIPNLAANTYSVTAIDANSCQITITNQVLTNPPAITFGSVTTTPQSCVAVIDGRIAVAASGGTGSLVYSLDGMTYQSNGAFEGLSTGPYTVRARDANSCVVTNAANVGIVPAIAPVISQTASVTCFGLSNAALIVNTTGGSGVYSYEWSNGSTTASISSLAAGTYDVEVTDDKGCTATDDFTIGQPVALTATPAPSDYSGFGVTCPGATDGYINLTISGGTAPYTYSWSNGATIKDIASLSANSYTVTVTDANLCQTNTGATLEPPTPVSIIENSRSDVICHGGSNGSVTVSASGGAGGYEYSIDNGNSWQAPPTFSLLTSGGYTVRVRDDNNCTNQVGVTINQPTLIDITLSNIVHTTCGNSNGAAEVSSLGGTGIHTYEWLNAASSTVGAGSTISDLPAGIYTIVATDQSACEVEEQLVINTSDGTDFLVTSITATSCSYSEDGGAQVQIVDGNGPYTIIWPDDVEGTSASHLPAGDNIVSVIDVDGCNTLQVFSVPSPAPLSIVSQSILPPVCPGESNASIEVQVAGGTGTYGYSWNSTSGTNRLEDIGPGDYILTVTDQNDCEFSSSVTVIDLDPIEIDLVSQSAPTCNTSSDGILNVVATGSNGGFTYLWTEQAVANSQLSGIAGGIYTVTATDARGCTEEMDFALVAPDVVTVTVSAAVPASCNGASDGTLTLSASGGVGNYSYSIDEGSNWFTSPIFGGLAAQILSIAAKDVNGCEVYSDATITQPDVITISTSGIVNTTCGNDNGMVTALAIGGNGTYTYQWINGANVTLSTSSEFTNAPAGNYTILVRDQLLCEGASAITILPSAASEISVGSIVQTACINSADGKAQVNIISGPAPHTYLWSSNETTANAIHLVAGENNVSVTDANNCVTTATFTMPAPSAISLSSEVITRPACPGGSTGAIQVLATGGNGGYMYQWNGTPGTNSLTNLAAGTYQLQVTDNKSCIFTKSLIVADVPPIEILLAESISPTCFGGANGSIRVAVQGGNGTYSLLWETGATGFFASGFQAGTYDVEVTDINGCKSQSAFTVTNPPPVVINVGEDKIICPGQTLAVNPQIVASSYSWTGPSGFSSNVQPINITTAGTYTLRIIDLDGCSAEDSFSLSISDQLLHADLVVAGEAFAMDTIMVIDISWPVPDEVQWDFGDQAIVIQSTSDFAMIQYEEPGTYTVTINANLGGCESTFSQNIRIYEQRDDDDGRVNTEDELRFVSYNAYPNPFREQLDIEADLNTPASLTLQLISVSGNKVVFETQLPEDFEHRKTFLTGTITPGMYVLLLKAGDQIKSIRLLKL